MKKKKIMVIKAGTNLITLKDGSPDFRVMSNIANQIEVLENDYEIILISSGAVGCGMGILKIPNYPESITERQICAAVGQPEIFQAWKRVFSTSVVAQVLVTHSVFGGKGENFYNFCSTTRSLLEKGIIPIINENDVISTEEVDKEFEDNDGLAYLLVDLTKASTLFILSDTCLLNIDNEPITEVTDAKSVLHLAGSKSNTGRGGMKSKLQTVSLAQQHADVFIIDGKIPDGITRSLLGENVGTFFPRRKW